MSWVRANETYTSRERLAGVPLFPEEVLCDPWVAYHGTSNLAEAAIEAEGFGWQPSMYASDDVAAIVAAFDELGWDGVHPGGNAVLETSSTRDFGGRSDKPIYFAPIAEKALLYGDRDCAGGEAARAIRHALWDLRALVHDEGVQRGYVRSRRQVIESLFERQGIRLRAGELRGQTAKEDLQHLRLLWEEAAAVYGRVADVASAIGPPPPASFDGVCAVLSGLAGVERRVLRFYERYEYGVIYAVRFTDPDILDDWGGSGLAARDHLEPQRIVAKAWFRDDGLYEVVEGVLGAQLFDMPAGHGVVAHARNRKSRWG